MQQLKRALGVGSGLTAERTAFIHLSRVSQTAPTNSQRDSTDIPACREGVPVACLCSHIGSGEPYDAPAARFGSACSHTFRVYTKGGWESPPRTPFPVRHGQGEWVEVRNGGASSAASRRCYVRAQVGRYATHTQAWPRHMHQVLRRQ